MKTYNVTFKHIKDSTNSHLLENVSMTAAQKYVASMKKDYQKNNMTVWGWCNNGISIPNTLYIEIVAA